jgi:hypothetical protein
MWWGEQAKVFFAIALSSGFARGVLIEDLGFLI